MRLFLGLLTLLMAETAFGIRCFDCAHTDDRECVDVTQHCDAVKLCSIHRTISRGFIQYVKRCVDPLIDEAPGSCNEMTTLKISGQDVQTRICYCNSSDYCNTAVILVPSNQTLFPKPSGPDGNPIILPGNPSPPTHNHGFPFIDPASPFVTASPDRDITPLILNTPRIITPRLLTPPPEKSPEEKSPENPEKDDNNSPKDGEKETPSLPLAGSKVGRRGREGVEGGVGGVIPSVFVISLVVLLTIID